MISIVTPTLTEKTQSYYSDDNNVKLHGCGQIDSRLLYWATLRFVNMTRPCSDTIEGASGIAWWKCNSMSQFHSPEPDRSNCSSSWVKDIENMAKNKTITATAVTKIIISDMIIHGRVMFGGDLLRITKLLESLSIKKSNEHITKFTSATTNVKNPKTTLSKASSSISYKMETTSGAKFKTFTENMFYIVNNLFGCSLGWSEIPNASLRYDASTRLLQNVEAVGFTFLNHHQSDNLCGKNLSFASSNLSVILKSEPNNQESGQHCFYFTFGHICLLGSHYQQSQDCNHYVASSLTFNNENGIKLPMFPHHGFSNRSTIIGLSINNHSRVYLKDEDESVQIVFNEVNINI